MRVDDFDFDLPPALIATAPAEPRDAARLLVVRPDGPADRGILDLPSLLRPGDLMVFNNTRVIPARLLGRRGAARVELTLHRRLGDGEWRAFAKGAKRLRLGDLVAFGNEEAASFAATIVEKHPEGDLTLRFDRGGDALRAALERYGAPPLPPYIKRPVGAADRERYQTIYAETEGAVAAPTAGLHFTQRLFDALDQAGIARVMLTLHVGAGTFLPVKVDDTRDHRMHSETASLDDGAARQINAVREAGGRVVAVGTTSLRTLESAADASGRVHSFAGETDLFITPGYRFKAVDLLLTNFHLPRSTLFMLVAAFSGLERMKSAYEHAKAGGYRFFSYGDACLLDPGAGPAGGVP